MTISTTSSRQPYNGNGVTVDFPVPFRFFANTDLVVQLVTISTGASSTLTLGTHYTVTGADDEDGGSLTMVTAPAVGQRLVIRRVIAATQEVDYVAGDPFPAETHERALDRLTMLSQQGEEVNARALVFPSGDTASGELPAVASRANRLIGFDNLGNLVVSAPASGSAAELALSLAGTGGAGLVGYGSRTLADKMEQEFYSLIDAGVPANDTGAVDRTALFLAAIATGRHIRVIRGQTVRVSNWLDLNSNQCIHIETGARINQVTAGIGLFRATSRQSPMVWNDGIIHGPGVWSPLWTSNGAQQERGVMFRGCTNGVLAGSGVIRNFGHAQFAVLGGSFKASHRLEGTHTHGTPIASGDNWQMGAYVTDDDIYGPLVSGEFIGEISGVCQGVLRENREAGASSLVNAGILNLDVLLRDIPGQHGLYIQRGNLQARVRARNIELSACKISVAGFVNATWSNFECNVVCEDIGGNMFEIESLEITSLNQNLTLNGTGTDIRGAALSLLNGVKNLRANLEVEDCVLGFQAQGVNQTDVDVTINGSNIEQSGVAIYSTNSDFRIRPVLRECNSANTATDCGILVQSASATVDLYDPVATDANGLQNYALFNSIAGSIVRVHGRAVLTGGQLGDIRATGVIESWPEDTMLDVARVTSLQNVRSPYAMRTRAQTTTASNVVVWQRTLPNESAIAVTVSLVGKLAGSAQRASYMLRAVFFRDGGAATIQGSVGVLSSIASGSFAGAYSLTTSGNDVVLLVNSGGAAVYDWTTRVSVEEMA